MATLKKKDFVEIEYTGKLKEEGMVFDTTDEKTAKDNEIHQENQVYGPVVVCIGEQQVLAGIDQQLEGKEPGQSYTLEIAPEDGFGKKNAKLIQLVNTAKFKKQGIQPMPGLQVNIDGTMGVIRTVTGGRTIVDFNHPLSGKDLVYDVKVNKLITEDSKKLEEYLKLQLSQKDVAVSITEGNAKVELATEVPKEFAVEMFKKISELIPSIKDVVFTKKEEPAKEEKKETSAETPAKE